MSHEVDVVALKFQWEYKQLLLNSMIIDWNWIAIVEQDEWQIELMSNKNPT